MARYIFVFCVLSIIYVNKIASLPLYSDSNSEESVNEAIYDEEPTSEFTYDELTTTDSPPVKDENSIAEETTTPMVDALDELFQDLDSDNHELDSEFNDEGPVDTELTAALNARQFLDETDSQSTARENLPDESETIDDLPMVQTVEESFSDYFMDQLTTEQPLSGGDETTVPSDNDDFWLGQNAEVTNDVTTVMPNDVSQTDENTEPTVEEEEIEPAPVSLDVDVLPQEESGSDEGLVPADLPSNDDVSLTVSGEVEDVSGEGGEIDITEQIGVEGEASPDVSTAELEVTDDELQSQSREPDVSGADEQFMNERSLDTSATEAPFINEYPQDPESTDDDSVLIIASDLMEREPLTDEPDPTGSDFLSIGSDTDTAGTPFWNPIASSEVQPTPQATPWNAPTLPELRALLDGLRSTDNSITAPTEPSLTPEILAVVPIQSPEGMLGTEDVSFALNILLNSTPENTKTVHITTIDMDGTDMKLSLVWKLDPIVMNSCNKYNSSSQTENAMSLLAQLKKGFPMYNWNVFVSEKIPQSLQFTYRGKFRATCNGNEYAIWFSTGKSEDNNKDIRSSSS